MTTSTTAQPYEAYVIEADGTRRAIPIDFATSNTKSPKKALPTWARRVAGGALMAVGIPMLILPGPGIAALAIGAALLLKK